MLHPPFQLPRGAVLPDFGNGGIFGLARDINGWLRHAAPPPHASGLQLEGGGPVILMVIDGLGDAFLQRHGQGSTILRYRQRRLTSVFPSTTASAVTTLLTGLSPARHGLTGWFMHDRRFGGVIAPLPLYRRGAGALQSLALTPRLFPYDGMFQYSKVAATMISPQDIAWSPFSCRHGRGAELRGYAYPDAFVPAIVEAALQPGSARRFIHAYYPRFDAVCHHYGAHSPKAISEFARIDRYFDQLLNGLSGRGASVILTADHGFIDAPDRRHLHLSKTPKLEAMLDSPLFGERRVVFCRVRQGAESDFEALARVQLRGRAVVQPSGRLIDAGFFGPGPVNPRLAERCGTHVLLMEAGWTLTDRMPGERLHRMTGVHGGLSADEMWVPLVHVQP
ncbi:phosphodiesterase [Parazoarcus communis]|uniref:Phosphodiesterase n=1 Tax=Parazoarcus communis TaxID=41977 RepID=A0A2U8H4A2_9RHOO|nr:alkaline phosphatase family protein [Parazoarcus communis]AWI80909.1 phosphodiesterase [Parazoarcus communis]